MSNQEPPMENDGRIFTGFLLALVPITMVIGVAGAGMDQLTAGNLMFAALFAIVAGWLIFQKK